MTFADKIVIVMAGALTLGAYALFWTVDDAAERRLQIAVIDQPIRTISLDKDQDLELEGRLGVSKIEIRGGKARFIDSPCNNKQCIFTGWIEHSNELAACLPNGIMLSVVGAKRQFDTINF